MADTARWRELRIGIIAAIGLVAVSIAVLLFARVGAIRGDTFRLFLRTGSASGLMKGSEVWVGGQRVGRVVDIRFLPPAGQDADALLVEMEVIQRYRHAIRRDSRAQIRPGARMIAAPVVRLDPGSMGSRLVVPGDTLRARPQADVQSMAERFGEATRELPAVMADVKRVNQALRSPGGTIGAFGSERGGVELAAVRARGGRIAASLTQRRGTLGLLLGGRDQLMGRAERVLARADSVQSLFGSPENAVGRFRRDSTLKLVVADIQNELSIVRALLRDSRGTAGRVLHDRAIVESLMDAEREMGAIMADIRRRPLRYLNF
jgi:phospholipid/cholesterol/gamma-HCH transport system substrate-binding protein